MKLGQASFAILFHTLECQLKANKSAVVETAFIPKYHNAQFLSLRNKYSFTPVEILCKAEDTVLYERFIQRIVSKERHPGHVDHLTSFDQFSKMLLEGKYEPLKIGGSLLTIDMTDFDVVDFDGLVCKIVNITEST